MIQWLFPNYDKKIKAREAEKLRDHFTFLMLGHIIFLLLEVFVYNPVFSIISSEVIYLWLSYYCYMTLNNCAIWSYIILMMI